ncbi:MAG: ferredoxin reductase [Rhodoferax sp.]
MTTSDPTLAPSSSKAWPRIGRRLSGLLQHPWVQAVVRESATEDALQAIHPLLSLTQIKAQVVRIISETAETKTFVLQPNAHWTGAISGQFIRLQTSIDGRRVERVYSLSSRGDAAQIAITVKRLQNGLMSGYLHTHTKVGDVFTISQAMGVFVLPDVLPAKLLLLSAGSGITPVMSMLRELNHRGYRGDVVFMHACRGAHSLAFAHTLASTQSQWPALRLVIHPTTVMGRPNMEVLQAFVPDLNERTTYVCGPATWMDEVHELWKLKGFTSLLHSERFGTPAVHNTELGAVVQVNCQTSQQAFAAQAGDSLLTQAELAGLTPKYGCRMGICHSCQCHKVSGTVENMLTGEVSSEPNQHIRLCISAARSDVTLAI